MGYTQEPGTYYSTLFTGTWKICFLKHIKKSFFDMLTPNLTKRVKYFIKFTKISNIHKQLHQKKYKKKVVLLKWHYCIQFKRHINCQIKWHSVIECNKKQSPAYVLLTK